MRAVIPPERSCKALRRVPDSDVPPELDIFRSRYGTFKQQVPFPACKEPLEPGGKPPAADGGPPRAELVRAAVPVLLLSFKWTLQLMLQSAKGVALCHRIGIAHRDLEPWNLMFDRYGRIKIIDFGDSLDQVCRLLALHRFMPHAGIWPSMPGVLSDCCTGQGLQTNAIIM